MQECGDDYRVLYLVGGLGVVAAIIAWFAGKSEGRREAEEVAAAEHNQWMAYAVDPARRQRVDQLVSAFSDQVQADIRVAAEVDGGFKGADAVWQKHFTDYTKGSVGHDGLPMPESALVARGKRQILDAMEANIVEQLTKVLGPDEAAKFREAQQRWKDMTLIVALTRHQKQR